jgi:hypothetical protein
VGVTKPLTAKWTYEDDVEYNVQFGQHLEQELTKHIQKRIDWAVLRDCLVDSGWTQVKFDIFHWREAEIDSWLKQHCVGEYKVYTGEYIFERPADASHFILRWL